MSYSRLCKIITVGVITVATIVTIIIVYHAGKSSKCPEQGYLFDSESGECYLRESKGPCQHNLIFLDEKPKIPNGVGQCSCPYTQHNRSVLYHRETERCYFVFTQAYCENGMWLTIKRDGDDKGKPVCETNSCIQDSTNLSGDTKEDSDRHYNLHGAEIVPIKGGGCAELGTHMEGCPEGSKVEFHKGFILPSCGEPPKKAWPVSSGTIGVPPASCPLGSYPSIMGRCQPDFQFDFE